MFLAVNDLSSAKDRRKLFRVREGHILVFGVCKCITVVPVVVSAGVKDK